MSNVIKLLDLIKYNLFTLRIHCAGSITGDITAGMGAVASVKSIGEWLVGLFILMLTFVGAAVFAWGLYKLALSIKDDQPEEKVKAISFIVTGLFLIAIKMILQQIGLIV